MRKNYVRSVGLAIVFMAIAFLGKSQTSIGFGANGKIFGLPPSQFMSGYVNCNIWLKNCGTTMATINGNLRTEVDTSATGPHLLQLDTIQNIGIPAGDSTLFSFQIYLKLGQCRVGNNILVIWPSLSGSNNTQLPGCDTITTDSLQVLGGGRLGMNEAEFIQGIFPNPAKDKIHVQLFPGTAQPEYISIFDVAGREWMLKSYSEIVSLEGLDSGLYFIRLLYADKRSITMRIVKTE